MAFMQQPQVFDFFYDDLRQYNFDKGTYSNILQTINSFTRYFPIVETLGKDEIKVFKTLVLMQMLHEFEHEAALSTTKNNIETALIKSNIIDVGKILEKLKTEYFGIFIIHNKLAQIHVIPVCFPFFRFPFCL